MRRGRKTLVLICTIAMLLASAGMVSAEDSAAAPEGSMMNFTRSQVYEDQFEDVADSAWYRAYVSDAYEYGIVSGDSANTFSPEEEITIAQALVIACQLHSIYYGQEIDRSSAQAGAPWYQPYVDYALAEGIIWPGAYGNYDAVATRAIFAGIMARALPEEELQAIGAITSIPDVSEKTRFSASIYTLYNAGILGGADEYGSFHPYETIRRSEVAVVVLNMADSSRRKAAELKEWPELTLYSDSGATKTVLKGAENAYLSLGWRTEPVVIPEGSDAETILNSATLEPMKTNNEELDSIIDGIFAEILTEDMTTYQKTKAIYDYLMDNCYYGWGAVSWSGKYVMHDDDYVVVMGKHILKTGHGTCDNYSAAFVAMARRIGLNAYFARGYAGNMSGYLDTHEIAIVSIGGVDYSFDPQIDDYSSRAGHRTYSLFCKPFSTQTGRYKGYDLAKAKAGFGNFVLK